MLNLLRKVFYKAENADDSMSIVISLNGNQIGVNISNLIPDTAYDIRIEAYTNQGQLIVVGNLDIVTLGLFNVIFSLGHFPLFSDKTNWPDKQSWQWFNKIHLCNVIQTSV